MNKTDILLLLLFADNNAPIVGTTRLQKLLFLTEHEKNIKGENKSFEFNAFKFGPVSKILYDDIEFLLNIGFLEKTGESSDVSTYSLQELDTIDAKNLLDGTSEFKDNNEYNADELDEKECGPEKEFDEKTASDDLIVYRISKKGVNYLRDNNLINSTEAKQIDNIKKRYGKKSLIELLKYVYLKYPGYATESEIKDQLL